MEKLTLSYKRDKVEGDYDAIIIGSGLGGMTTGAFLAKAGWKILVLERHYVAGGFTHVFKRRGYEWDVGVHYIGSVHKPTMMKRILDYASDTMIEWADMGEVYDRMVFGDKVYEYRKGREEWIAQMKEYFPAPEDQEAIDTYMKLIIETQIKQRNYFIEKTLPKPLAWAFGGKLREKAMAANKTTLETLSEFTTNKELIAVLCGQFGDYGLPPGRSSFLMHSMLFFHYINGGYYPVGGSSVIFKNIAPTITKNGGHIYTNAEVEEIIIEGNKAVGVRMKGGQELRAKKIISSAGVVNTFTKLLPQNQIEKYGLDKLMTKVTPSTGHVCLYVGLNYSNEELKLPKANYWIFPENYNHDENIDNYLEDQEKEIPVVYVSFPSSKDPDWENRYPGKTCIDIITLADWDWYKKWEDSRWKKRGDEYEAAKEKLSQRLLEKLYRYEPQLRGKIDHYELSTPLTTKHFVNYQYGELYGLDNSVERFEQKFLRPKSPIKNLFLTGQDVVSVGVGGALASGLLTSCVVARKNFMKKINEMEYDREKSE